MKMRRAGSRWDVPAPKADCNPPLALKKGKLIIRIMKSAGSSKTPDITHAVLCSDWHSVLQLLPDFDKYLIR